MNWLIDNWYLLVSLVAVLVVGIRYAIQFFKLPSDEQKAKVREWLLWAVSQAERDLGGGTGKLKFSKVYGMFVENFAWIAEILSITEFSDLVDDALIEMRRMLEENAAVASIIKSE